MHVYCTVATYVGISLCFVFFCFVFVVSQYAQLIEMCAEPYILIAIMRVHERLRVTLEMLGLFLKSMLAFVFILVIGSDTDSNTNNNDDASTSNQALALFAMAYAQLLASVCVLLSWVLYWMYHVHSVKSISSNSSSKVGYFTQYGDLVPKWKPALLLSEHGKQLLSQSSKFFVQSSLKYALTEGEKLVMIALHIDPDVQGIYSLVCNLGVILCTVH